jgi:hypothetical protein
MPSGKGREDLREAAVALGCLPVDGGVAGDDLTTLSPRSLAQVARVRDRQAVRHVRGSTGAAFAYALVVLCFGEEREPD